MRGTSFDVLPICNHAFFEQPVLQRDLGQRLLELPRFNSQILDFILGRFAHGIAGEPFLAGFEEVFGPAIVKVLVDTFLAAQLSDRLLATQAFKDDADLLFR